ncbi:MAG: glycoside hydrolase [Ignavibacteriales bacterium]|nr:glycoside hydrolase [Ignavibacteriales bacterium]
METSRIFSVDIQPIRVQLGLLPVVINDDPNTTANHQWMPAIWCDKETGRLYAKWFDTRNVPTSDSAEVYASYSDNGGVTWVANQNLSTSKI